MEKILWYIVGLILGFIAFWLLYFLYCVYGVPTIKRLVKNRTITYTELSARMWIGEKVYRLKRMLGRK